MKVGIIFMQGYSTGMPPSILPLTKKIRECFTEYNTVGMNLRLNLERKETTMVKDLKEEPGL